MDRRVRLGALGLMAFCSTMAAPVGASSPCVTVDLEVAYAHARYVFVGQVRERVPSTYEGVPVSSDQAVRALYTLTVVEEFKGTGAAEYQVVGDLAPPPSPSVESGLVQVGEGWPLELGARYLIFAWGSPPRVDPCPPSAEFKKAGKTIKLLRRLGFQRPGR
jgi:hypothetical protein